MPIVYITYCISGGRRPSSLASYWPVTRVNIDVSLWNHVFYRQSRIDPYADGHLDNENVAPWKRRHHHWPFVTGHRWIPLIGGLVIQSLDIQISLLLRFCCWWSKILFEGRLQISLSTYQINFGNTLHLLHIRMTKSDRNSHQRYKYIAIVEFLLAGEMANESLCGY